jgi:hypothetical protein
VRFRHWAFAACLVAVGPTHRAFIVVLCCLFVVSLDKTGDGVVRIDDLAAAYDVSKHPLVKAGDMTPEQALTEFLGNFGECMAWLTFLSRMPARW